MKLQNHNIQRILRESINRLLVEKEQERDMYTHGGEYSIDTAQDLKSLFFDPKYTIYKGGIVKMTYVKSAKLNLGYNYNTQSGEDFESQGRGLGKKYVNDFYDSNEYKNQQYTGRGKGLRRPLAIFELVTQDFQWAVERYDEKKRREDDIYNSASDEQMLQFIKNDAKAQKRLQQYIAEHPDQEDEINSYLEMGTLPNDIAKAIVKTKLGQGGGGWDRVDNSDYLYRHEKTQNEGLRLTRSSKWKGSMRYAMVMDGQVKEISKEEYFHWKKVWNSDPKATTPQDELTDIAKSLNDLDMEFMFNNYLINNIVKLSFSLVDRQTKQRKPITFINKELVLSDGKIELSCDGHDLEKGVLPMSENKKRTIQRLIKENVKQVIREMHSDRLHNIIMENLGKILHENVGIDGNNPQDWIWQMANDIQSQGGMELPCGYYCEAEAYGDGEIYVYMSRDDAEEGGEPIYVIQYDENGELEDLALRFDGDTIQILDAYLRSSGLGM